ncbi:MAG: fused MFS/spermidine synthase [Vicinamibacteria bacterium]|nr:fused MFS/spermidine synthase [Vicinamibacteria bacterium]
MKVAQAMGLASALNTLGAILGAGLAGFFLLPELGLDHTLRLSAFASALSAAAVALQCRRASRMIGVISALAVLGFLSTAPSFDQELFAGGAYKYSAYDMDLSVEDVLRRGELISYAEGRVANVSVKRVGAPFSLAVDGKVDATSGGDMLTQRLLAHVPFLIHEKPRTALVIGFGSGVTARAALTHDPEWVTSVEISPDVVEAARRFFATANGHVLESPKLRLIVGDARQHVLATRDQYDVIISEPSNPWMAGVSALFTREFFRSVKARLSEAGVFCQWGHLYNMSESDLATLLATFSDVFPSGRIFVISEADILIVGSEVTPALSERRVAAITEEARLDLAASGLSSAMLSAIPTVALVELSPRLEGARRHTDDAPVLDFSAPLSIHAQTAAANRRWLIQDGVALDESVSKARLALLNASGSAEWIYDLSEAALSRGHDDLSIARDFVKSAVRLHRTERAEAVLSQAISRAPRVSLLFGRALLLWNTARPDEALRFLEAVSRLDPNEASAYLLAAEIQSAASNLKAMRELVARALALNGQNAEAIALFAEAELKDGRLEAAARLAAGAVRLDPKDTRALEVLALALAQQGRATEARHSFARLLEASPEAAASRNNFGVFELQEGNAAAAARLFEDAADLDPANRDGYRGLKEAALILNRPDLLQIAERGLARLSR